MFERTTPVAWPSTPASPRDLPSTARYRCVKQLASGEASSMYVAVARDAPSLGFLVHRVHEPRLRADALAAAEAGGHVVHRNVLPLVEVDDTGADLLLVRAAMSGTPVDALARDRVPLAIAVHIVLDALEGLAAVHAAGCVHGHLNPHNVIVGEDGVTRLAELGILERLCPCDERHGYTAPEALESGKRDASSDTYALAVVLWEMLAGRRLFAADGALASLRLAAAAHVPTLIGVNRSVPAPFDALIKRALARSPRDRFESAVGFAEALARLARFELATRAEVVVWLHRRS